MIRISIGIEDPDDLIADLNRRSQRPESASARRQLVAGAFEIDFSASPAASPWSWRDRPETRCRPAACHG
jgi:hypothetical protein